MCASMRLFLLVFLSLVLLFSAPVTVLAEDPATQNYEVSNQEMNRLLEIWTRLEALNEQLQNELAVSKGNLQQLQNELASLSEELAKLRIELGELKNQLEQSQTESVQLKAELQRVDNYLTNSEKSFGEYKAAVEAQISKFKRQRVWALGIGILIGLAF